MKAIDVARYFVYLSLKESEYPITHLKLQKLLYYAQGFHYLWDNEKLVDEEFQAWQFGPVLESVYHHFKRYGYENIPITEARNFKGDQNKKETIEAVWRDLKDYSAHDLVEMTHDETPWKEAHNFNRHTIIPEQSIKNYFIKAYS